MPTSAALLPHLQDHLMYLLKQGFLNVFNLLLTNSARQMANLHLTTLWKAVFFWYQVNGFILLVKQHGEPLNYNEVLTHF